MNTNNRDYGTTQYEGETYIITCEAWVDNYGSNGDVAYYAYATKDNKKYRVMWYTTEKWDKCTELYNLEQELANLKSNKSIWQSDINRIDEIKHEISELESEGYATTYVEDESNACDWDNANTVEEIDK